MKLAESVFLDGRPLGRLTWDEREHVARFVPGRDELRPLSSRTWPCPVEAREAVQKFALEAGLGSSPAAAKGGWHG